MGCIKITKKTSFLNEATGRYNLFSEDVESFEDKTAVDLFTLAIHCAQTKVTHRFTLENYGEQIELTVYVGTHEREVLTFEYIKEQPPECPWTDEQSVLFWESHREAVEKMRR